MDIKILLNEVARRYKIYEEYNSADFDVWYKLCEQVNNLEQQLEKKQDVIDKVIEYIKNGDLLYIANKNSVIYKENIEVVAISDRLNKLLQILEDKEVE